MVFLGGQGVHFRASPYHERVRLVVGSKTKIHTAPIGILTPCTNTSHYDRRVTSPYQTTRHHLKRMPSRAKCLTHTCRLDRPTPICLSYRLGREKVPMVEMIRTSLPPFFANYDKLHNAILVLVSYLKQSSKTPTTFALTNKHAAPSEIHSSPFPHHSKLACHPTSSNAVPPRLDRRSHPRTSAGSIHVSFSSHQLRRSDSRRSVSVAHRRSQCHSGHRRVSSVVCTLSASVVRGVTPTD